MISIKVTYKVKPEFVAENQENIRKFLDDFKQMNNSKFRYSVYLLDDGQTFMHLSNYSDEIIQKEVLNVKSFLYFQKKRDESGLEDSHKVETLNCIGSSFPII